MTTVIELKWINLCVSNNHSGSENDGFDIIWWFEVN